MKTVWILYCAMQAVPAIDPTPHATFDSLECSHQARVSSSFGELYCVCAKAGFGVIFEDRLVPLDTHGIGSTRERFPELFPVEAVAQQEKALEHSPLRDETEFPAEIIEPYQPASEDFNGEPFEKDGFAEPGADNWTLEPL
jgi:hypothetical protein